MNNNQVSELKCKRGHLARFHTDGRCAPAKGWCDAGCDEHCMDGIIANDDLPNRLRLAEADYQVMRDRNVMGEAAYEIENLKRYIETLERENASYFKDVTTLASGCKKYRSALTLIRDGSDGALKRTAEWNMSNVFRVADAALKD